MLDWPQLNLLILLSTTLKSSIMICLKILLARRNIQKMNKNNKFAGIVQTSFLISFWMLLRTIEPRIRDKSQISLLSTEMELVDLHSLRNVWNSKDMVGSLKKQLMSSNQTINLSFFISLSIIEVQLESINKMVTLFWTQAKELLLIQ